MRSSWVSSRIQQKKIRLLTLSFLLILFTIPNFINSNDHTPFHGAISHENGAIQEDVKNNITSGKPQASAGEPRELVDDWQHIWNGSLPFKGFIEYNSLESTYYTVNLFQNDTLEYTLNSDFNVSKYSSEHELLWSRAYGDVNRTDYLQAFMLSKNGSVLYVYSYVLETNSMFVYILNAGDGSIVDLFSFGYGYMTMIGKALFDPTGRYAYLSGIYYPSSSHADAAIWKLDLFTKSMVWNLTWGLSTKDEEMVSFDITKDGLFLYCVAYQYQDRWYPTTVLRDESVADVKPGYMVLLQINSTGYLHHQKINTTTTKFMPRDMCLSFDETSLNILATDNSASFTKMALLNWDLAGNPLNTTTYPVFEKMEYATAIIKSPWNNTYYLLGKQISDGTFKYHRGKIAEIALNGSMIWENATSNPLNSYTAYFDLCIAEDNGYLALIGYQNTTGGSESQVLFHLFGYNLTQVPSTPYLFSNDRPSWDNNVELNWTASTRAKNYSLYRSHQSFEELEPSLLIASGIEDLNYTDVGLDNGLYYYRVVAVGEFGNGTPSNLLAMTVSTINTPYLNPLIHNQTQNHQIYLTWTDSQDGFFVIRYHVFRNNTPNFDPNYSIPIFSTPSSLVTDYLDIDVPAGTWYYAVMCLYLDGNAKNSSLSNNQSITIKNIPSAPALTIQFPDPQVDTITINWSAVEGATSYSVYRTRGVFDELKYYSPIATTTELSLLDNPENDRAYKWLVIASNASGSSLPSNIVSAFIYSPILPPTLSGPATNVTNGLIQLTWSESVGAQAYYIYKSDSFIYSIAGMMPYNQTDASTRYFNEVNDTLGVFFFVVIAGKIGVNSSISNCVNVSVQKLPSAPQNLIAINADRNSAYYPAIHDRFINLTWDAVSGAIYYEVYRAQAYISNVNFATKIATTMGLEYCDFSLNAPENNNKMFFYGVTAVNWTGESLPSLSINVTLLFAPDPVVLSPIGDPYNRSVSLTWSAGNYGTYGYFVYRAPFPMNNTNKELIHGNPDYFVDYLTGLTYVEQNVPPGFWYYAIIPNNLYHIWANFSNCESVTVVATPFQAYLYQPQTPSYTRNVTLMWTEVEMADEYQILTSQTYILEEHVASLTPLAVVSAGTDNYTHYNAPGGIWYYAIIVVNASGRSPLSNIRSVDIRYVPIAPIWQNPPLPYFVNQINLTWVDSNNYQNYSVYRGLNSNFSDPLTVKLRAYINSFSIIDIPLLENTYYYWIIAHNASGDSFPTSRLIFVCYLVNAPTIQLKSANPAIQRMVHLDWSVSNHATDYKIFRTSNIPDNFSLVIPLTIVPSTQLSFIDSNIPLGNYYYTIIPVTNYGEGNKSQSLFIRVEDLPSPPTLLRAESGFRDEIIVFWGSVPNAEYYIVYMSYSEITNGTALIDFMSSPKLNNKTFQFTFDGIGYGVHYFVVVAINGTGTSFYSNCIEYDNTPPKSDDPMWMFIGIGVGIFLIVAIPLIIKYIHDKRNDPTRLLNKYI